MIQQHIYSKNYNIKCGLNSIKLNDRSEFNLIVDILDEISQLLLLIRNNIKSIYDYNSINTLYNFLIETSITIESNEGYGRRNTLEYNRYISQIKKKIEKTKKIYREIKLKILKYEPLIFFRLYYSKCISSDNRVIINNNIKSYSDYIAMANKSGKHKVEHYRSIDDIMKFMKNRGYRGYKSIEIYIQKYIIEKIIVNNYKSIYAI